MKKYVKIPIEIQATQWFKEGDHPKVKLHPQDYQNPSTYLSDKYFISTLDGYFPVASGDWIITGVKGEYYHCKDSIFKATYKEVP